MTAMTTPMIDGRSGETSARQDERAAFAAIVADHERRIYAFLRRMTSSPDDAADLTQETFLKAYKAFGRTNTDLNVNAWLHRIASNACLDLLRRRRRIAWFPWDPAAHDRPTSHPTDDPETMLLGGEIQREVQRVLLSLAPRQRQALLLRENGGLSCAEIGTILGVSEGAAKAILFRGREEFRKRYGRLEARAGCAGG
jgi:RNA polymerase sigma-70 factor (ECF subfamily)